MEILEIRSSHDLSTKVPDARPSGVHSYQLNCRQFNTARRSWYADRTLRESPLCVMTLSFERIWITETEIKQVAQAIETAQTPLALD